jgi:polyhydroxybutyrate depolymerase
MPARLCQIAATVVAVTVFVLSDAAFAGSMHPGEHFKKVTIDHLARTFIVHVPAQFDATHKLPVVIMLHGAGGSAEEAESYTSFDDESDREGFIVAYPNATLPFPHRASGLYSNPALWHERSGTGELERTHRADIDFISAVIDELETEYSADPDRIYITGFSNGASMTLSLGLNLSDRLAAIAPVAGQLPSGRGQLKYALPLLFIVGSEDPIHPIAAAELPLTGAHHDTAAMRTVMRWQKMLECRARKIELVSNGVTQLTFNDCARGGEIVLYTVEGLGHVWPGAPNNLSRWLGHSSCKLLATKVIWQFFKTHPRVTPAAAVQPARLTARAGASRPPQ